MVISASLLTVEMSYQICSAPCAWLYLSQHLNCDVDLLDSNDIRKIKAILLVLNQFQTRPARKITPRERQR